MSEGQPPLSDLSAAHRQAADLCEAEPIRTPGRLQGHGCLLAIDEGGKIVAYSDNARDMLALTALDLGAAADELFGPQLGAALRHAAGQLEDSQTPRPFALAALSALGKRFETLVHRRDRVVFWEFLPKAQARVQAQPTPVLGEATNPYRRALTVLEHIRALTGYDRVMMYQFHPDWSGEVIAELRAPEMTPYLGLRYPASDIPSQARALYLENPCRLIPNVNAPTRAIVSRRTVDLSLASLRAVSPYHLQYLRNMGVAATLTLSVIVDGRLWGMVSCHHRKERLVNHAVQEQALRIVQAFERSLIADGTRLAQSAKALAASALGRWSRRLSGPEPLMALLSGVKCLQKDVEADGVALVLGDQCLALGSTPELAWLTTMAHSDFADSAGNLFVTDSLARLENAPRHQSLPGAMIASLDGLGPSALFAFRRAQAREVHWGGDPRQPFTVSEKDGGPSPRHSFALWRETVVDRSAAWTDSQALMFSACARALGARLAQGGGLAMAAPQLSAFAQSFLRFSDAQHLLVDALPAGSAILLWTPAPEGPRLLYANRDLTELLGLDLRDVVEQGVDFVLSRTHLDPALLQLAPSSDVEVDLWSPARGLRHLRARRETVLQHKGAAVGETLIEGLLLQDITDSTRTQEALRSAIRQAEAADRARSALLRNMSHELRTPLNAILGYADLMAHELCGPLGHEAYREAVGEITAGARHLLGLINNTLEIAQLDEGKLRLTEAIGDLAALVEQCVALLQILAEERGVTLRAVAAALPPIKLDERAIKQVVINLISNALKFTDRGGTVTVTAAVDEKDNCVVTVEDTGVGIAEEDLRKLFKPFSQINHALDRTQGGNGLGLSIVKALVQLHGGEVEARSRLGMGSAFSFSLPAWRLEVQP